MLQQLTAFTDVYQDVIRTADEMLGKATGQKEDLGGSADPLMIGFAAASVIRTAADIFSLFKSNNTFSNHEIPNDDAVVVTCFSNAVSTKGLECTIYYPAVYPVHIINTDPNNSTSKFIPLLTKVKGLNNNTASLQREMEAELTSIEEKLMAELDPANKQQLQERKDSLNNVLPRLMGITATFSQLEAILSTIDTTSKITTYAMILRAERMAELLKNPKTYVIKFMARSNGSTRVTENLFRTTYIKYSGGTQLSCLIFASDGSIVFSDSQTEYLSNKASSEIITFSTKKSSTES